MAALGQRPGPHRRYCGGLLSGEAGEDAHPPYLPDLAPVDFFLFPKVKAELAGQKLMLETFKNSWEGFVRSIAKEDFATAFRRWKELAKSALVSAATMPKNNPK